MNTINIIFPFSLSFSDYPDDESVSINIFCMGCDHNCIDCQNPQFKSKDFHSSKTKQFTVDGLINEIINYSQRAHTDKIVLTGGDFLSKINIDFTKELLQKIKYKFDVCIYTGYGIDYCFNNNVDGFRYIKCGKFIPSLQQKSEKTDTYFKLASSNQEIYDSYYKRITHNGILKFS